MSTPYRIASAKPRAETFDTYRYMRIPESNLHHIALKFHVDQVKELIRFSFAMCSPQDNFCFKTAREKCEERYAIGAAELPNLDDEVHISLRNPFYIVYAYDRDASLVQNAIWAVDDAALTLQTMPVNKRRKKDIRARQKALDTYRLFLETLATINAYNEMQFHCIDNTPMVATLKKMFGLKKPALEIPSQ